MLVAHCCQSSPKDNLFVLRLVVIPGCIKLRRVAQTFQSAGGRNFPVPSTTAQSQKGDWKVALTSRLENLLYAQPDAALQQPKSAAKTVAEPRPFVLRSLAWLYD